MSHPSLITEEKKPDPEVSVAIDPVILEVMKQTRLLGLKAEEYKKAKDQLLTELTLKAHETYAGAVARLLEQIRQIAVSDDELKKLEFEVLTDLKRVLAKY